MVVFCKNATKARVFYLYVYVNMNLEVGVGMSKKNKIKKCFSSIFSHIPCIWKINLIKAGGRRAKKFIDLPQ